MKIGQRIKEGYLWKLGFVCLLHLTAIAEADVVSDLCPETCIGRSCKDPENNKFYCTYDCPDGYWGARCANECPPTCTSCDREFGASGKCFGFVSDLCPSTCINRSCKDPENNLFKCTYDCPDGYWGAKCANECPPTCTSCDREFGASGKCFGFVSDLCPATCIGRSCKDPENNLFKCTYDCPDGYWGAKCANECPPTCTSCDREFGASGQCFECQDGYYLTETDKKCTLQCPSVCSTCTSSSQCTKCKNYFYNTDTVRDCSLRCPDHCFVCESDASCSVCEANFEGTICQNCVAGKHGNTCDKDCPSSCLNSKCSRTTGNCINCPTRLTGNRCDQCEEDGKYGTTCEQDCSPNCLNKTCELYSGVCDYGCANHNFNNPKCYTCKVGFYNIDCSAKCPENCRYDRCSMSDGTCAGCKANFAGNICGQCIAGKYGENCALACSQNCYSKTCDQINGKCSPCKSGYYGENCDLACSPNCDGQSCNQTSALCSDGCTSDYSGDRCCIQGSHCDSCFSNQECEVCVVGFHGDDCNQACSGNCYNNACSRNGTACLQGCVPGYKGSTCSEDTDYEIHPLAIATTVVAGTAGIAIAVVLAFLYMKYRRTDQCCKQSIYNIERQTPTNVYDDLHMTTFSSYNSDYDSLEPPHNSRMPNSNEDNYDSHEYENTVIRTEI